MFTRYNQWANARLYRMAGLLPDDAYRRKVGVYFGSLHGTLNHLLTADRIWMRRLTHTGDHPQQLNAIMFDDFPSVLGVAEPDPLDLLIMQREVSVMAAPESAGTP
jgi:uncharacterized damage-inducible protein DinB